MGKRRNNLDFGSLAEKAIENVTEDRRRTEELLSDLIKYIQGGPDRHSENATALSKYVETLQRSNEQLVKLAIAVKRNTKAESQDFSQEDRDMLFSETGS